VIQGGVLERPSPGDLDEFDVDLDRLAGLRLLEQLQLPGRALAGTPEVGQAEIPKGPLDRAHGEPDLMGAKQPQPGSRRPVPGGLARRADWPQALPTPPGRPMARIPRHEPGQALSSPATPPATDGPDAHPISAARRRRAMGHGKREHHEAIPD